MTESQAFPQFKSSFRAEVVNNQHPKKWHMAQVRLIGLWNGVPEKDLPWAEYLLPLGSRPDNGDAMPVQKGDIVWVDFPQNGDTRYPRITGGAYQVPDDSHLPKDLFEQTYNHKRTGEQPASPQAQYGDKVVDLFGLLQQLTMNGDWCLTHKATGTAMHIDKDGRLVLHGEGDVFRSSKDDTLEQVGGNLKIIVEGEATLEATATKIIGPLHVTESITSDKDISDKKGSMQKMRDTYNEHTNPSNGTSPPPQKMN